MRVRFAAVAISLALICLLLPACSRITAGASGAQTAAPTPATTPIAPTAPPASSTLTPIVCPPSCPGSQPTPPGTSTGQVAPCNTSLPGMRWGDLLIYSSSYVWQQQYPVGFGGTAYPHSKVPDGTPLRPLQIQYGQSTSGVAMSVDPPTNPDMREHFGGYGFTICNLSSNQSHVVQAVSVQIASEVADASPLNEWGWCDSPFDGQSRQGGEGGCGGAYFAGEYLHATFALSAGSGASVPAAQVKSGNDDPAGDGYPFGPLPVTLKPGVALPINVGMTPPTALATYTFTFQITVDGGTTTASAPPTLLGPVAHEWGGSACMSSSMESQIPQASSPTYYLCPAS